MSSDEFHIEQVAAEAARLAIAGWSVDTYGWSHPDVHDGKPLDRATATFIQRQRDRGSTMRPSALARLPVIAPPIPAEDVPTAPSRRRDPRREE